MSWGLRSLYRVLSPAGTRARLSILIFHRVLARKDPLLPWDPDVEEFDDVLRFLDDHCTVLPLSEAVERLEAGTLPSAAASITFDDGYADNAEVALPLLHGHGHRATFFVSTGYLDGGRMFNDDIIEAVRNAPAGEIDLRDSGLESYTIGDTASRVACYSAVLRKLKYFPHQRRTDAARSIARRYDVPDSSSLMMTSPQLRDLHAAGFEVGGHTHTHPILELQSDADAEREISGGKESLERLLGTKIKLFAYPNGIPSTDFSARHAAMARRAGFAAAVSTLPAAARRGNDIFGLPRFLPWDRTPLKFGLRWAANLARS
ncbi:MAG TPA: polysaccharide deacetylase family protein [Casimicrobiaceae bacterium]|nr:polysaccharide deacetylase family protein [Casimicrobiaceae bacterium]